MAPQGYVEAAHTFELESGTPPGVDLGAITDRMEIRRAVQSGNVEEAIERVNDLNPEARPSRASPRLPAQPLAVLAVVLCTAACLALLALATCRSCWVSCLAESECSGFQ